MATTCQRCHSTLPSQTLGGFCPACLVAGALDSRSDDARNSGGGSGSGSGSGSNRASTRDRLEGTSLGPGGRYKLLQRIGEGGFGFVYMAEQTSPVHRRVAVKILKAGMDTNQVVARFEAERQALAMMDHPNIARVLDGGETEHGRPYFVMELVRGTPITEFCDREKLETPARLRLYLKVCRAVQHAHQKGIIHRDLKPANILVTVEEGAEPVPKVIDFGVAKAVDIPLTDRTLFTRFEQMVGTPAYMSPEQAGTDAAAAAADVDTRADIYALGVLLYELITGTTPFEGTQLERASNDEIRRILREEDAPRPSARISSLEKGRRVTIAKHRGTEAGGLGREVRGDLDWIVMKAIEKDRRRRYQTANDLALDVERFLRSEAIEARPPSTVYLVRKFTRRHRAAIATLAGVIAILVAATAVATTAAVRARKAERLAETRLKEAEKERSAKELAYTQAEKLRHEGLWNYHAAQQYPIRDAWESGRIGQLEQLMARLEPADGDPEFRSWEWIFFHEQCRLSFHSIEGDKPTWHPRELALATVMVGEGAVSTIDLRNPADGSVLRTIARLQSPVAREITEMRWSADGSRLAFLSHPAQIVVLDATSGHPVAEFNIQPGDDPSSSKVSGGSLGDVATFDLSPDGRLIATAHRLGLIQLWHVADDRLPEVLHDPNTTTYARSIEFSPDSAHLAVALRRGRRLTWEIATGTVTEYEQPGDSRKTGHVAWAPAGLRFSATESDHVSIYDVGNRQPVATLPHPMAQVTVWTTDGRLLSTGLDQSLRVWDAATLEAISESQMAEVAERNPVVSADGKFLSIESFGRIKIVPLDSVDRTVTVLSPASTGDGDVQFLAWSPDGTAIASAHIQNRGGEEDRTILTAWDTAEGQARAGAEVGIVRSVGWTPEGDGVTAVTKNAELLHLALGADVAIAEPIFAQAGSSNLVSTAHFSGVPLLAVGTSGSSADDSPALVRIVDPTTRDTISSLQRKATLMQVSNDHRRIAIGGLFPFSVWEPETNHATGERQDLRSRVTGIAWSPDDVQIALARRNGSVHVIDSHSAGDIGILDGHIGTVFSIDWSHNGRIATAGLDGTVRLWDDSTGSELLALPHPRGLPFLTVAWSPDGRRLAAGDSDGNIFIWGSPDILPLPEGRVGLESGVLATARRLSRESREAPADTD